MRPAWLGGDPGGLWQEGGGCGQRGRGRGKRHVAAARLRSRLSSSPLSVLPLKGLRQGVAVTRPGGARASASARSRPRPLAHSPLSASLPHSAVNSPPLCRGNKWRRRRRRGPGARASALAAPSAVGGAFSGCAHRAPGCRLPGPGLCLLRRTRACA